MIKICFQDNFIFTGDDIFSTFYIDICGNYFPDKQWTDFPISVLHMWILDILENIKNDTAEFDLQFMDGPYYINCIKRGKEVNVTCIEDKKEKNIICKCSVDINIIIRELLDVSSKVIQAIELRNLDKSNLLDELKKATKMLKDIAL